MSTYFVRTIDNRTIVDIEATKDDVHCAIDIFYYTRELFRQMACSFDTGKNFIDNIERASEIRGEYFEQVGDNKLSAAELAKIICMKIADEHDLMFVED